VCKLGGVGRFGVGVLGGLVWGKRGGEGGVGWGSRICGKGSGSFFEGKDGLVKKEAKTTGSKKRVMWGKKDLWRRIKGKGEIKQEGKERAHLPFLNKHCLNNQ